jgi:hypothetical protein
VSRPASRVVKCVMGITVHQLTSPISLGRQAFEEWLKRAVKAQERAPPFAWNRLFFPRGHRQQALSQCKDLDGSIASADLDISDRHRVGAVRSRGIEGHATNQTAGLKFLVQYFESLGQVHCVPIKRVSLAFRAADGAGGDRPGSDANAEPKSMALKVVPRHETQQVTCGAYCPRRMLIDR